MTVTVGTPADVTTTECPYHFKMSGTISVDSGPTDVVYSWLRDGKTRTDPVTLHFAGTGAQTKTVTDDDPETLADGMVTDMIEVVGPYTETVSIRHPTLRCVATAATPTVFTKPTACPRVTFIDRITVPIGGQTVDYTWHFSNGRPDITGQYTFPSGTTARFIAISQEVTGSLSASLELTNGVPMTTASTTATCP